MPKNTRKPKSRQMQNVDRKAHLAINQRGALEHAYMTLSTAVIEFVRKVESKEMEADEAVIELINTWRGNDAMLLEVMRKIESLA